MKTKLISLVLVCLMLEFCASAPPEKMWASGSYRGAAEKPTQQTLTITDIPYDRVWDICEKTLIQLGSEFYVADKNAGEIRIRSVNKSSLGSIHDFSRESEFLISISRANGTISATFFCTYYWDDALKDSLALRQEREKREIERVIRAFKKNMEK